MWNKIWKYYVSIGISLLVVVIISSIGRLLDTDLRFFAGWFGCTGYFATLRLFEEIEKMKKDEEEKENE